MTRLTEQMSGQSAGLWPCVFLAALFFCPCPPPSPAGPEEETRGGTSYHLPSFAGLQQSLVQLASGSVFFLWPDPSPGWIWVLQLDAVLYPFQEREVGRRHGVEPVGMGQDRLEGSPSSRDLMALHFLP